MANGRNGDTAYGRVGEGLWACLVCVAVRKQAFHVRRAYQIPLDPAPQKLICRSTYTESTSETREGNLCHYCDRTHGGHNGYDHQQGSSVYEV